jgi:hypothetical protein
MELTRASRCVSGEFLGAWRLARAAHPDRSATGDGFLINNYD